jgi:hypothetical protein
MTSRQNGGLLVFLAMYIRINNLKTDQYKMTNKEVDEAVEDACNVTEECEPQTEEDFYRLASLYFLYKPGYDNHVDEEAAEHRWIYG